MAEPTSNKAFPVSWDQFHRDARALAWRLAEKGPFEAIVCITRGGLVPAAIICRELGLRLIETVCVASYHDYKNQSELKVLKDVAPLDQGDRRRQGPGRARRRRPHRHRQRRPASCAKCCRTPISRRVYAKPAGVPTVDTFVTEVSQDTWIYFPWDMGLAYVEPISKDHKGLKRAWAAAVRRRSR